VLGEVVQNSQDAFRDLSQAEKDDLIKGLDEYKATKARGMRTSNKSRINDVTHTVDLIEREVRVPKHLPCFVI
jgi:hypothetical protein